MRVRFWGTRGSIATPGPDTIRFGGNTSCCEVVTDAGHRFLLDCGTGARPLGAAMLAEKKTPIKATILLGHTHWDHIQGFPFFAPLFGEGNEITVCGPEGVGRSLRDVLAGQMEFSYFPVELDQLPAKITFRELGEGTHEIGGARVVAQFLNHPTIALGYRIEADDAAVLYLCDHEPFSTTFWHGAPALGDSESIVHEGDRRHAKFMAGAGLVIHDAQYTPEEFPTRKNWGHSTYEYAVGLAVAAGVRQLVLTHHDPTHDDAFVERIQERAREYAGTLGQNLDVLCAHEGLDLPVARHGLHRMPAVAEMQEGPSPAARRGHRILVVDDNDDLRDLANVALTQDGHTVNMAATAARALELIASWRPELVLLDRLLPDRDGLDVLKSIRKDATTADLPVLVLTGLDDEASTRAGFEVGATDYLTKPFSIPQLAARVRACLARVPA